VLAQAAVLACEERWDDPELVAGGRRTIQRFLTERLEQAFRTSLQAIPAPRPTVRLALACRVVGRDGEVSVDVDAARGHVRVETTVRVGWLVRVWRAGLAAVGDLVVLDVLDAPDGAGDTDDTEDADGDNDGGRGLVVRGVQWERHDRDLVPRPRLAQLVRKGNGVTLAGDPVPRPVLDPWWTVRVGR